MNSRQRRDTSSWSERIQLITDEDRNATRRRQEDRKCIDVDSRLTGNFLDTGTGVCEHGLLCGTIEVHRVSRKHCFSNFGLNFFNRELQSYVSRPSDFNLLHARRNAIFLSFHSYILSTCCCFYDLFSCYITRRFLRCFYYLEQRCRYSWNI